MSRSSIRLMLAASWIAAALSAANASAQSTSRASVGPLGLQSDGHSYGSALSDDGNIVVFSSYAKNFVSGDNAGTLDIFVRDVANDSLTCLSLSMSGVPGTGQSFDPHVSADGRYVVFVSDSPSLVPNDTNGTNDVFWFDRQTSMLERVSVDSNGNEGLYGGYEARISKDGQLVMFSSGSPNLVPNDTNGMIDVFVHDVRNGVTERVSVDSSGNEGSDSSFSGGFSADDRQAVFASYANDLDPSDANPGGDVFVKDRQTGALTLVSLDSNGNAANDSCFYSTISGDGNVVAFVSYASNLVAGDTNNNDDVFVRDLRTGVTTLESTSTDGTVTGFNCYYPLLSDDGRYVAFSSLADLTPNPSRLSQQTVFLRDRVLGFTLTPAEDSSGNASKGESDRIALSGDGQFMSFYGRGADLVPGDTNKRADVFVHQTCITPAAWTNSGSGLAGTLGVPALTASAPPALNTTITLTVGNSLGAQTTGALFLGDTAATLHTSFGSDLLLLPTLVVPLAIPVGGYFLTETVPADEFLCGVVLYGQTLEADAGAIKGVSFTPRIDLTFGR